LKTSKIQKQNQPTMQTHLLQISRSSETNGKTTCT
jgi:hypothetical protein